MNALEDRVEDLLKKYNKTYKREGVRIRYGSKASKGKCDFILTETAIECKEISDLKLLTIPGFNKRTGKLYTNPKLKQHQLKFLRHFDGTGYLLIHETDSDTYHALTMHDLDMFLLANEMPRTLKGIEHKIDLEEFIGSIK